ncbi:MAG: chemotaxis protein CheB [Acidobacteriota bacterium]
MMETKKSAPAKTSRAATTGRAASRPVDAEAPPAAESEANATEAPPPAEPEASAGDGPVAAGFPVVGIGASAGGLSAFEAFFSGMPADLDPGMAFVLVQHLAPDHKSILTDLIRRYTRMQVFEVEDGMAVQPNCAYIIPPNRDMAFLNGTLQLMEPSAPRGRRLPIDFFFRSLAADQRERAICVVLSGTGSDGTLGLRAIKGEGGMVMVQNAASTEYDGMPRSALATGLVDFELPPAEMPAQIMAYVAHAFGRPPRAAAVATPKLDSAMRKIFVLLRAQTGHDFSQYKPTTIHRRVDRRMAVLQIDSIDGYVKYLQQTPTEVEALFRDLLIGVTNFFRDPESFRALEEQVIGDLCNGTGPNGVVRVWVPGCSTAEEAYSVAILIAERQEALKRHFAVQIFATDIDPHAIAIARAGLYPASVAADLTPERLARFFSVEPDGGAYRIHKGIRDMVVFSEQNVIKDPPFSKLDLISCRNLLIYLGADLQRKLIPLFHYALKPGGVLFLGSSETVGDFDELFAGVDRKAKIYRRTPNPLLASRAELTRFLQPSTTTDARTVFHGALGRHRDGSADPSVSFPARLPLRDITEQALLTQSGATGALVNSHGDLLYLHGRTGRYLELTPGEAGFNNVLKMAREGLRRELTTLLHKATMSQAVVSHKGLRVKTNGDFTDVNVSIMPVAAGLASGEDTTLYLLTFQDAGHEHSRQQSGAAAGASLAPGATTKPAGNGKRKGANGASAELAGEATAARVAELTRELRAKDEYLQSTNEELETSNEELKSSNEEMQSVNEELQSTNEELETSKEELQSVNEELATVNGELQAKVNDLSRANNDMSNLLAGTGIGTIFVDHQLRILRFTPAASQIINLIPSDVGRPVGHIVSNLVNYDTLVADVTDVLARLIPKDFDVKTTDGRWFAMRILPYRTAANVIEGGVLTFVDITDAKRRQEALVKANDLLRLAVVVRDAHDAITVQDLDGFIIAWNPGAARLYGWSESDALKMNVRDRIPLEHRADEVAIVVRLAESTVLEPYRTQRLGSDGTSVEVWITATALINETGRMYAIATTERAIG